MAIIRIRRSRGVVNLGFAVAFILIAGASWWRLFMPLDRPTTLPLKLVLYAAITLYGILVQGGGRHDVDKLDGTKPGARGIRRLVLVRDLAEILGIFVCFVMIQMPERLLGWQLDRGPAITLLFTGTAFLLISPVASVAIDRRLLLNLA